MFISVIIPHYNSSNMLSKLLDSISIDEEIEIIVVDDKSTLDIEKYNSLKKEYKNVDFYDNNSDKKGAGVCRNIGLSKATGQYILFADSDDYFVYDLKLLVTEFRNTDFDVVFFRPTSYDLLTHKISNRHNYYCDILDNYSSESNTGKLNLRYKFHVPWSKLVSNSLLQNNSIEFDEVMASNDVMFSTKVGHFMNNFAVVNKTIYCVTKSAGTLTRSVSKEIYYSRLNVFIEYYNFLRDNLSKKDFSLLKLDAFLFFKNALFFRYSLNDIIKVVKILYKNKINIIKKDSFNIIVLIKRIIKNINELTKEKKYR